ncbi:hypothetical protein FB451DRAFT_1189997 [Mycena latifolia]|nr:hypothetical protein FB451DRAFT_1189997 [Mycena latifolia]
MSHQSPPEQTPASSTAPKRIYIACVHCRKRKIRCITSSEYDSCERCARKGLECEYLPIPVEQIQQPSQTSGWDGPPARSATPGPHMPISWTQAPQTHGGYNAPGTGPSFPSSTAYSNLSHYNPMNEMPRFQSCVPSNYAHDHSSRSQYPGAVQHQGYSHAPMASGPSQYPPSTIPPQRPATAAGYHVDYSQMFPDPGLNNAIHPNKHRRQASHFTES